MKFACDACQAQYMIADEKVRDRAVKVKCKKCGHVIVVRPPVVADDVAATDVVPPAVEAPPDAGREGTLDNMDGDGFGGLTEESMPGAELPEDSDETHVMDRDEAQALAAVRDDIEPPPPPALAADATHVAPNPLAGLISDDAEPGKDLPFELGGATGEVAATQMGDAVEPEHGEGGPSIADGGDEANTVLSGPGVYDDESDVAKLDLDNLDGSASSFPEVPSPFDSGVDDGGETSDALLGDSDGAFSGGFSDGDSSDGAFSDGAFSESSGFSDGNTSDDGAFPDNDDQLNLGDDDVPAPPMGDDVEAALSGEGAPVEAAPPFDDPNAGIGDGFPSFDDDTAKAGYEDPTVAGPMADLPVQDEVGLPAPPPAEAGFASEEEKPADELDEQLAGAFNQMFSEPGSAPLFEEQDEDAHNPTQVLNLDAMEALRKESRQVSALGPGLVDGDLDDSGGGGPESWGQAESEDEPEWHVAIDDEDVGPLSLAEVRDEVTGGRVLRDSLVWKVGMDDWYPAEDIPEIAEMFSMPAPKSLGPTDVGGGLAGFDVGDPVDDMGPSPFGGPENSDPFGQVQDISEHDPSWQPHGLTDVYQAANLAEAGGVAPPPPAIDMPADDDSEAGWRPGAASALSALVANEIERIDTSPASDEVSGPLLPADEATSGEAPELGISPSSTFAGLAAAELSGSMASPPMGGNLGPELDSGPPLAAYPTNNIAMPSYPGPGIQAEKEAKPIVLYGIIAVVSLFIFVFGAVALVAIFKFGGSSNVANGSGGNEPVQIAKNGSGANGNANGNGGANGTGGNGNNATDAAVKAPDESKTKDKTGDNGTKVALLVKDDPAAKKAPKDKPKKEAVPPKKTPKVEKKPSGRRGTRSGRSRGTDEPKPKPKPPKPKSKAGCDPVLDFDCDDKPKRTASKAKTLSRSDILSTVKKNIGKINACGRKNGVKGIVKMRWQIARSGKTKNVSTLTTKYKGKPIGACMVRAIKRMKFPAYSGKSPGNIDFPFKLK